MRVATLTTWTENGVGLSVVKRLMAGARGWIPAFAGMTVWWWYEGYSRSDDSLSCLLRKVSYVEDVEASGEMSTQP